jgi:uncharacterized linocin/CFP29 family protein
MNETMTPSHQGNHTGGDSADHPMQMGTGAGHMPGGASHAPSHHGRDKIDWSPEVWRRIDAAVREEITRSRVGAKFLPTVHVSAKTTTVPSDTIVHPPLVALAVVAGGGVAVAAAGSAGPPGVLFVDETATTRINEVWVDFSLTAAQVEEEAHMAHGTHGTHPQPHPAHAQPHQGTPAHLPEHSQHQHQHQHQHHHHHHHQAHASTGISLATRAANILAQVEDTILFQGQNAFQTALIGSPNSPVGFRFQTQDLGLLNLLLPGTVLPPGMPTLNPNQIVPVSPATSTGDYQDRTVKAISTAFSVLQSYGQYGPYALVLQTNPYADANSPLPTTLITPAEPIRHLMNAGFFGTGTLPPFVPLAGGGVSGGLNGGIPSGGVTSVKVTAGGAGYLVAPTVNFVGGGAGGAAPPTIATAVAVLTGNAVTSINITNSGSGYISVPAVTVTPAVGDPGVGATAVVPTVLYSGFVVSLGGNTMDLVRGKMSADEDVVVRFEQKDANGYYRFRVVERFTLRLKDITSVVQLQFLSV